MKAPAMNLDRKALSQFENAIQKEWIITNGLGGYSSSTVLGVNTRKYHGLLVSAFCPPGDRRVCLAKLDEEVTIRNNTYSLGANEFQTGIFPRGYDLLQEFSLSPFPKFTYLIENATITKSVFMPHEKNAVIILYRILNKGDCDVRIRVFPLVNSRPFHSTTHRWKTTTNLVQQQENGTVKIRTDALQSTTILSITKGQFHSDVKWVEGIEFREEAARGESHSDDCYQPGFFETVARANSKVSFAVIAVADKNEEAARRIRNEMPLTAYDVETLYEREVSRREKFLSRFYESKRVLAYDWLSWLVSASDAFIVRGFSSDQKSVIAGYHWFEAWGRDTFLSLPGLMLVTGRFEDARKVFLTFKKYCRQGLIPNLLPESCEEPIYNSVDATLWFVNAILQYLKYTDDFRFVHEEFWSFLTEVVENHAKGTLFDIRVDGDGLLSHGPRLTWMDAMVDDQPVTPRTGRAVEVQALWYNTLRIVELLANRFREPSFAENCRLMAEKARASFVEKFWNAEKKCLFDVVNGRERDGSFRPNQILAVSLDFVMLDDLRRESVVDAVHRELLTPYGLRTLERSDPRYVGVYVGDRRSRDRAYHNGAVWPWLIGPFATAYLKVKGHADFRREFMWKNFLSSLTGQVFEAGLGSVSEVFDGDPPHLPRGCIAQAWSVAELLRTYVEDVLLIRPSFERDVMGYLG